jgi:CheY-like chemotaxis protein/HPt (histidine-containing phosphotransfer) domain-containing protein
VRLPQRNAGCGALGRELSENLQKLRIDDAAYMKKARLEYKLMPRASVLVVDDVETNLYVSKGLMAPYGLSVNTAASGYEAIDELKSGRVYDIIFMDHMMPRMDGIETTARIRQMGDAGSYFKQVPIIALTANAVSGTKEMFMKSGFDDFLSKPIDIVELSAILERWIPEEKQEAAAGGEVVMKQDSDISIEINGLDTGKGIAMTGRTLDNYLSVLGVFYKDGIRKVGEIKTCLETGNLPLYITHVHALKSAAASIGAGELSETSEALELAGLQGDLDFIRAHSDKLLSDLEILLRNIHSVISAQGNEKQNEPINMELLKTELSALKAAMVDFDTTAVNESANNLQVFSQAADISDVIANILHYKLTGEYDEAVSLIDMMLQNDYRM